MSLGSVSFRPASESSLLITFESLAKETRFELVQRVHRLLAVLDRSKLVGIRELTPAYSSLLIEFNPLQLNLDSVESHVRFCPEQIGQIELPPIEQKEVPVFYGGDYGVDLAHVSDSLGMTVSQLVSCHCETIFTVAFFGFLPGFAYLEGWPQRFAVSRLDSPRPQVPAGSVGLAGNQCGIYPKASPGGWRLIGRTPLPLVDPTLPGFSPFRIGMQLRFYPADPRTWGAR